MLSNRDKYKGTKIVFFIIGLVILMSLILYSLHCFNVIQAAEKIESTIINITENHTTVKFVFEEKEIIHKFNYTNDFKKIGDTLTVYYLSETNTCYIIFSMIFPNIMFLLIGLPFFIFGLSYFINNHKLKKFYNERDKMTKKVAKVKDIKMNKAVSMNNQHPSYLVCEVYYEGEKLILKSKSIWEYIRFENNYVVDIYFVNKKKYFIDLESYRKDELYYEMEDF